MNEDKSTLNGSEKENKWKNIYYFNKNLRNIFFLKGFITRSWRTLLSKIISKAWLVRSSPSSDMDSFVIIKKEKKIKELSIHDKEILLLKKEKLLIWDIVSTINLNKKYKNISYTKVGNGPHLCFLHGFCEDSTIWENTIHYFSKKYKFFDKNKLKQLLPSSRFFNENPKAEEHPENFLHIF